MSSEQKKQASSNDASTSLTNKVIFDIKHLEKRLAELIELDQKKNKVSFGFLVLTCVAHGQYERAFAELDSVGEGLEEYELFEARSRRFVEHAKSLVAAIKTKHMVGKSPHVNKSKQKELSDRIAEHFMDLKRTIIVIEKIQKSVRTEDLSSTVIILKTAFVSCLAIFIAYTVYINSPGSAGFSFRDISELFSFVYPF